MYSSDAPVVAGASNLLKAQKGLQLEVARPKSRGDDGEQVWNKFQKRRHLKHPPDRHDESKIDLLTSPSTAKAGHATKLVEFVADKVKFYDKCLHAGRELTSKGGKSREGSPERPTKEHEQQGDKDDPKNMVSTGGLDQSSDHIGEFVQTCKQNNILPTTTGVIRRTTEELKLEYGCIDDKHAEAICHALSASEGQGIKQAFLRSNGLSDKGAMSILNALPETLQTIDLSSNNLGHEKAWWTCFQKKLLNITELNVSDCLLGDKTVEALCEAITVCKSLRILNVSANNIGRDSHKGARALGTLVGNHKSLRELDAHWNHITGEGALLLARGLLENAQNSGHLKDVDLSWNPLCREDNATCEELAKVLKENNVLYHLNLAKCDLNGDQCKILADALKDNTTLFGIHMKGNNARVDNQGFIVPITQQSAQGGSTTYHPPDSKQNSPGPPTASAGGYGNRDSTENQVDPYVGVQQKENCCWVCERWREVRFAYIPGVSGPEAEQAFVFTSIDEFAKGTKMTRHGGVMVAHIMCGPGPLTYVFQVGAEVVASQTASISYDPSLPIKVIREDIPAVRNEQEGPSEGEEAPEWDPASLEREVTDVNTMTVAPRDEGDEVAKILKPRKSGSERDEPPEHWDVTRSLFAPYHQDDLKVINKCFEFDWRHSQIQLLVANEVDRSQLKELLREHYAEIKLLFTAFCSAPRNNETPFGIGLNEYTELLIRHSVLHDDLRLNDADAHFIATAYVEDRTTSGWDPRNKSGCSLARHMFLQLLVRLAEARFARSFNDERMSHCEAMKKLLNRHLMAHMRDYVAAIRWRSDVLHTEQVEIVLQKHAKTLVNVFQGFGQKGPNGKHYMEPSDWFSFLDTLEIMVEGEPSQLRWDRVWLWRLSAMTHVDELTTCDHMQMRLVEFLEALARSVVLMEAANDPPTLKPDADPIRDPAARFARHEPSFQVDKYAKLLEGLLTSSGFKKAVEEAAKRSK